MVALKMFIPSSSYLDARTLATLALISLALVLVTRTLYAGFKPGLRSIPGPWSARFSQIFRLKLVWSGKAHEKYPQLHKKYGPIVRTAPNVVDIADPKAIHIIYGINSKYYKSNFYNVFSPIYEGTTMHSMFTTRDPEYHKALKRPVAQKFSMSSIKTLEYLVDPCSQIFHDAMIDLEGQRIDLGLWLQFYAFDVISAITFSQRLGFMERREDVAKMIEQLDFGLAYGGYVGRWPWIHKYLLGSVTLTRLREKFIPNAPDPVRTATGKVKECLKEYDKEEKAQSDRYDFLAFLRQQGLASGASIPDREIMNHLLNNFLAGSDTTAISLRAIFYYILRDPQVYDRLRKEINDADQAGKLSKYITYAESLELGYLQDCIKEAMRMHPGVMYPLERIVPRGGAELCGHFVPEGTIVGINAATIHRNKDVFGIDADEFRPSRWTEDGKSGDLKEMERSLLTFGAGARTCIGKNISIMEMGKFVPQILRHFDLEWASNEPEWRISTYWFAKQSGLYVKFKKRIKES